MSTLREKIKELCKEKGVSLRKAEKDLGFGAGYLSKLDSSSPNSTNLKLLSDYFDVSYSQLAELLPKKKTYVVPVPHLSIDKVISKEEREERFEKAKNKVYGHLQNDVKYVSGYPVYYTSGETARLAQEMFEDTDMRALFHMKQNMEPEKFAAHMNMMKQLYKLEHPEDFPEDNE